jgi:hypothetical protein
MTDPSAGILQELLTETEDMSDDNIWTLAVIVIGAAALRAAHTGHADVHRACLEFIDAMHKFAGTPPGPKQ